MNALDEILMSILERLQEHDRLFAGSEVRGKVNQVDVAKKRARIVIGKDENGGDVLSPWLPYAQTAGKLKIHTAPSIGQVMSSRSEGGDLQQGVLHPFHWSDDNKSPSDDGSEHVLTLGDVQVTLIDGGLTIKVAGATFKLTGAGFEQTGGFMKHDGHLIDKNHIHTKVVTGGALSGPPE